jgi:hypothetical protein
LIAMAVGFVLVALIAVTIGLVLLALRRRPRTDDRVRLYELMRLQQVRPAQPRDPAAARDTATAERRCAACASKELCDELLRTGDTKGFRQFCPNALYVEWQRSNSLKFD